MDNIPAVGAAASTEAAGADTAELIYSGAAAAAREAACSAQEEAKGGCGQGSAGESSDAVYRDLSAPAAGVGTATAHARESQFLHRWGCNDLVHEALVELGRHRPNPNPNPNPIPNLNPGGAGQAHEPGGGGESDVRAADEPWHSDHSTRGGQGSLTLTLTLTLI